MTMIGKHTGTGLLLHRDSTGGLLHDPGSGALLCDGDVYFNRDAEDDPAAFGADESYSADSADRWSYSRDYILVRKTTGGYFLSDDEVREALSLYAYPNELAEGGADSALLSVPGIVPNLERATFRGRISCATFRPPAFRETTWYVDGVRVRARPAVVHLRGASVRMSVSSNGAGATVWCGYRVFDSKPDRGNYPGVKFYQFSRTTPSSSSRTATFPLSIDYTPLADIENDGYTNTPVNDRPHIYVAAFPEDTFFHTDELLRRVELSFSSLKLHTTVDWQEIR